eukprot:gene351-381_t
MWSSWTLNNLPEVLQWEILLLLDRFDYMELVRISRSFYQQWSRKLAPLKLRRSQNILRFFTLPMKRNKILNLIDDPVKRFQILMNSETARQFLSLKEVIPIASLNYLKTTFSCFYKHFMSHIEKIHRLDLFLNSYEDTIKRDKFDEIDLIKVKINELSIENSPYEYIPTFPSLQALTLVECRNITDSGLNIHVYENLTYLKLSFCASIKNVDCLDQIHHLHLELCDNIADISGLNRNHSITISGCSRIRDYSHSFKYSKFIYVDYMDALCSPINTNYIENVEKLKLRYCRQLPNVHSIFPFAWDSLPTSLRSLTIEDDGGLHSFPPNQLQQLTLRRCPFFNSLKNLENVTDLTFEELKLNSVDGLGWGNRVVRIIRCHHIKSFEGLMDCTSLEIDDCNKFVDSTGLENVKVLKVRLSSTSIKSIRSLRSVTHLITYEEILNNRHLTISLTRLRDLTINYNDLHGDGSLLYLIVFLQDLLRVNRLPRIVILSTCEFMITTKEELRTLFEDHNYSYLEGRNSLIFLNN